MFLLADSTSQMISEHSIALPPQQLWEDDNTYMDDAALLCSIARISRDVEMLQASLIGNRRRRDFTPGSADRDRPDKFIRVDETPARCLKFSSQTRHQTRQDRPVRVEIGNRLFDRLIGNRLKSR